MYTIGQVARRFGLSRSTLLYYDAIGLLSPSARSGSNYRLYTEGDLRRMEQIAFYRDTGLPLEAIGEILDQGTSATVSALETRLAQIHHEMEALRQQQRIIGLLLQDRQVRHHERGLDKAQWIAILRASGLNEEDMARWHREFERMAPAAHQAFLESLGIPADEIGRIREFSRRSGDATSSGGGD
jgi:DNA-binding transcriptional MerR regulator